jgi:hypothetical protein
MDQEWGLVGYFETSAKESKINAAAETLVRYIIEKVEP